MQRYFLRASPVAIALALSAAVFAQTPPPAGPAAAPSAVATTAGAPGTAPASAPGEDPKAKAAGLVEKARTAVASKDWKGARALVEEAVAADPQSASAHGVLGLTLKGQKKWGQALKEFDKAASLGATDPGLNRAAAECAEKRKDKGRLAKYALAGAKEEKDQALALKAGRAGTGAVAYEAFDLAQSLGKLPARDLPAFADAAKKAGKLPEAAAIADQAYAGNPKDLALGLRAAQARIDTKELEAAQDRATKLLAEFPGDPKAIMFGAQLAQAKGDTAGEKKLLEELTEQKPKFAPAQKRLGVLLLAAGDVPGARTRLKAATDAAPDDADAHRLSSEGALLAGDKAAAVASGRQAVKLAAKDAGANAALGRALFATDDFAGAQAPLAAGHSALGAAGLVELGEVLLRANKSLDAKKALAEAVKKDAGNARAHELLGDAALVEKRFKEAVGEYKLAAAEHGKDVKFLVKQAQAAQGAGDVEGATAALDSVLAADPTNAEAGVARAQLHRDQGQAAKAAALLGPVAEANPKDAHVAVALAEARMEANELAGAQSAAEGALALDKGSRSAHDVLGRVLYGMGQKDAARSHLEAACAQPPRKKGESQREVASGDALVALGDLELAANKKDSAKSLAVRAKTAQARRAPVLQAKLLQKGGDLNGAERAIAGYLTAAPDDGEALQTGADIAYDRAQWAQARERFEKAVEKMPKGALTPAALGRLCDVRVRDGAFEQGKEACAAAMAGGNDSAGVHASMGLALYRLGDKTAGKAELEVASKKGAKDAATQSAIGAIALEEGRTGDAMTAYNLVLAQDKNNAEANAATGRILAQRGEHKAGAARMAKAFASNPADAKLGGDLAQAQLKANDLAGAQKTLKAIPDGALPVVMAKKLRGQVEYKLGNYKRANEEYEKALAEAPADAELLQMSAENFLKLPNYDKAIAQLEKARAADPKRVDVAQSLTRLYAETGQTDKVAKSLAATEALETEKRTERRKDLDPKEIRTISFSSDLKALKGTEENAQLAHALSNQVVSDFGRSAYVELIDLRDEEALKKEKDRIATSENVSEQDLAALKSKEKAAQYVLSGEYAQTGEDITIDLKAQSLVNRTSKSAHQSGPKKSYAALQKAAVLEILSKLEIPLSAEEQAALERTEGSPNLESFLLTAEAQKAAEGGDVRRAADLYKKARDTDQGNAQALVGLENSLVAAEKKNQIGVVEPTVVGEVPEALPLMVRRTLQSKLSGVRGVKVVEQEPDPVVKAELDRIASDESIDPASFDVSKFGKSLAATVLVRTEVSRAGDDLSMNARLQDTTNGSFLYGTQRTGKLVEQQKLQNQVAKDIVQFLRGEPTDEEKAALEATLKEDDYQKQMAEFARLKAEEKARKEALAKAPPQEKKPEVVAEVKKDEAPPPKLGPISVADDGDRKERNIFAANLRLTRFEAFGNTKAALGLNMTHVAWRSGWLRTMIVMDFESTRGFSGRPTGADTDSNAAFYGGGLDLGVPVTLGGFAFTVGAEGLLGLGQAQQTNASVINNGFVLTIAPHAGMSLLYKGVGLSADLGYRLPFTLTGSLKPDGGDSVLGLRGFFLQGGIKIERLPLPSADSWTLGYTAHLLVPNQSSLSQYTSGFVGGGSLLEHTVSLTGRDGRWRNGAWISYGSQAGLADNKLTRIEASYVLLFSAFKGDEIFNPYVGLRLGAVAGRLGTGDFAGGLIGAAMAGLDFQLASFFALGLGGSYDAQSGDLDLSGYAIDANATLRF